MGRRTWLAAVFAAALALALGATLASGRGGHARHGGSAERATASHQGQHRGAEQRVLFAVLRGRNELSGQPLHKGAGDPDGRGSSNVTIDGTDVCWGIAVTNLSEPVAAHIHRGKRNQNGSIVVSFVPPALPPQPSGDPGATSGCTTADADLALDIQRHPHRYYVNVHTVDFPGGAARGQLFAKRR